MDTHHLVEMANQIGKFFSVEPDRTQALFDIANHLRRFWDPRMRTTLLQHIDQHAGEGLDPFVAEALRVHRQMLTPASGPASAPPRPAPTAR